jgi:hypothetical protein
MPEDMNNHINTVRALMLEQLRALRTAPAGTELAEELKRSKGVSELSQTIINSARVEVDYLAVIHGDGEVPFLAAPDEDGEKPKDRKDPLLKGPGADHPWRTSVVHKLKG